VGAFRVPEVLLLVAAQDVARAGGDEVGHVAELDALGLELYRAFILVGVFGQGVDLADGAGDDVDVELSG
jgi:hypothetical protein